MKKSQQVLIVFLLLLFLGSAASAFSFYRELSVLKSNPQVVAKEEADLLISRVSQLIVLPAGEMPTIATVSDIEKLKERPFFANAKNGDKVLIYTQSKKAILYDPVNNKIVEVAPVNIGNPEGTEEESSKKSTN